MNKAPTFFNDFPYSDSSTESGSSPAATRAQDYDNPNPENQESDLLNGAEHEHLPKASSVGGVVDLECASIQGLLVLSSTNDSHSTIFSNHPQVNDEETPDIEGCAHAQVHTNGKSANESTNIDISADQITNEDTRKSQVNPHGCTTKSSPRWTPFALRRPVLLGFSGLLLSIIAGLETLNYISNQNQGLTAVAAKRYYLWKFGPTFGMFYRFSSLHVRNQR